MGLNKRKISGIKNINLFDLLEKNKIQHEFDSHLKKAEWLIE